MSCFTDQNAGKFLWNATATPVAKYEDTNSIEITKCWHRSSSPRALRVKKKRRGWSPIE